MVTDLWYIIALCHFFSYWLVEELLLWHVYCRVDRLCWCVVTVDVLQAGDPSKVRVYGPAVEAPVKAKQTTYLIVDCKEAGQGQSAYLLIATLHLFIHSYITTSCHTSWPSLTLDVAFSFAANFLPISTWFMLVSYCSSSDLEFSTFHHLLVSNVLESILKPTLSSLLLIATSD